MRYWVIASVGLGALAGCGETAPTGCIKDTDCYRPRVCQSGVCVDRIDAAGPIADLPGRDWTGVDAAQLDDLPMPEDFSPPVDLVPFVYDGKQPDFARPPDATLLYDLTTPPDLACVQPMTGPTGACGCVGQQCCPYIVQGMKYWLCIGSNDLLCDTNNQCIPCGGEWQGCCGLAGTAEADQKCSSGLTCHCKSSPCRPDLTGYTYCGTCGGWGQPCCFKPAYQMCTTGTCHFFDGGSVCG